MKHNPRLNERVAALPGHARLHPAQDPRRAQGALELMWSLERSLSEICGLPHVSLQPSAGSHGELAGSAAHPRLPRGQRRGGEADQGPDARHRPRHQPGLGDDGRLRGRQGGDRRARRRRPRGPAGEDRRPGRLPDADQPEHAGPVRHEHRRDHRDRSRGRRHPVLRRRQPERDHGALAPRRHGLRHRSRQPAQVVQPAARRRRPGGGTDRRLRADRAVPAGSEDRAGRGRQRGRSALRPSRRATTTPTRSAACAASRAISGSSSAPTHTSSASAATVLPRPPRPRS